MKEKKQTKCKTCILSESSIIHISENGNCNICNSDQQFKFIYKENDKENLLVQIDEIKKKGENNKYDCIVGWSGGRDSTALLYELIKTHKLRCLAMFFKTPFTPNEIIENVHSITRKLGFDLIERETPKNHLEIAAYCTKLYAKTKLPIMINLACAPCKLLNREIFKHARKLNVKSIIYGGNRYEYIPLAPAAFNIESVERYSILSLLKDNIIRIKKGLEILGSSPKLIKYIFTFFQASILYVNPHTAYLRFRYPKISRIDYYFIADWNESRIKWILNELEWELPAGCNSTWRADCAFEAIKNLSFKKELGFSYADAMYSNLIRSNKMSRAEGLQRIEEEGISEQRIDEVLRLCDISEEIFSS